MGAGIKSPPESSPYSFRIRGQIYRFVSPLYPNEANMPRYEQLHIFDSAEATKQGLKTNQTEGLWP
jgi:hypothetical protein